MYSQIQINISACSGKIKTKDFINISILLTFDFKERKEKVNFIR